MARKAVRLVGAALVAAVAVAVAVTMSACGGGAAAPDPNAKVELSFIWWGSDVRAQATDKAVDLFEQKNPNITVKTSFGPFDSYFDKLATQIGGGGAPDVLQMDKSYLREYGERGALVDLGKYLGSTIKTDSLPKSLLEGSKAGDKQYSLPFGSTTQSLFYNPATWQAAGATLPKAGWTWADLQAAAKKITDANKGETFGVVDFGYAIDWFEFWFRQQGKTVYTPDGKLGFTEADLVKFWEFTGGFRTSGAATTPDLTTAIANVTNPQATLRAASGFNYDSGFTTYFTQRNGSAAMAPWPSDTSVTGMYLSPPMMLSVSSKSKHPAEAAKLIDFLLNDVEAGKLLGTTRGVPANTQVRDALVPTVSGADKMIIDFESGAGPLLGTAPPAPPRGAGAVKRTFQQIYESVSFGRTSIADGAKKLIQDAEKAIS